MVTQQGTHEDLMRDHVSRGRQDASRVEHRASHPQVFQISPAARSEAAVVGVIGGSVENSKDGGLALAMSERRFPGDGHTQSVTEVHVLWSFAVSVLLGVFGAERLVLQPVSVTGGRATERPGWSRRRY